MSCDHTGIDVTDVLIHHAGGACTRLMQLFGIVGQGKQQVVYAEVSLYVVDVTISEVVVSVQGAGEYKVSNREVLGFGGTPGYEATLNGKVLDLAIRQAVDGLESGRWPPTK